MKPQLFSVGVFLSDGDSFSVLARVSAKTCGRRRFAIWTVLGHLSLSPGLSSLVRIQPLPWGARAGSAWGRAGGDEAGMGRLVDPGHDCAMQVVEQVAPLAAGLEGRAAVGDELLAASRSCGPADLVLEHDRAQGVRVPTDRGQRSGRSRAPWVGCPSDRPDGRATGRYQRGTLPASNAQRSRPGYPRGALAPWHPGAGWVTWCRGRFPGCGCGSRCSLVHGGGGACDAAPPTSHPRVRSPLGINRDPARGCPSASCAGRRSCASRRVGVRPN